MSKELTRKHKKKGRRVYFGRKKENRSLRMPRRQKPRRIRNEKPLMGGVEGCIKHLRGNEKLEVERSWKWLPFHHIYGIGGGYLIRSMHN